MKNILFLVFMAMLWLNSYSQEDKHNYQNKLSQYPKEITKLGLEEIYDKTKWFLYCIECDRQVPFSRKSGIKENITYGNLPLNFDRISIKNDTVEIDLCFYYKAIKIDEPIVQYPPYWGAVYCRTSKDILKFSLKSEIRYISRKCFTLNKCPYREVKPLQPEVIKYIKQNKNKLDPWFRQEAIKRGVIK